MLHDFTAFLKKYLLTQSDFSHGKLRSPCLGKASCDRVALHKPPCILGTLHSEREKMTRQAEEEVGRQHQGMDRLGVRQVSEGGGQQGKVEETGCKIICGAPTTLAVKG